MFDTHRHNWDMNSELAHLGNIIINSSSSIQNSKSQSVLFYYVVYVK